MSEYREFGYRCLGPLLLGFSQWLEYNVRKEGIDKIYFFSRDGFIMKKAFDALFHDNSIKTYYLEVSRRSLRVPILWKDFSFDNLLTMLGPSRLITLRSIFDAVGLDITNYSELINKYGFDESSFFYRNNIKGENRLMKMYDELSNTIKENSLAEYANLNKYIKKNELHGKFAIVDIGWSGGMQRFLETTLREMNIEAEIVGYYTGIADHYKRNNTDGKAQNLNGYLFDFYHHPDDDDVRSCFVGLYELLFLETKGSVMKYVPDENGDIKAKRYDYEYFINGHLLREVEKIKEIQEGALDYINSNKWLETNKTDAKTLCRELIEAGQRPSSHLVQLFADFRFFDEGEYSFLARPKSLFYYMLHPRMMKEDFLKSRWKTAFLKRLFLVPAPYYALYKFVKRHAR